MKTEITIQVKNIGKVKFPVMLFLLDESDEREFEDGIIRKYSYEVCNIPANCRAFTIGDRVKISLLGGIEREFEVKGFHRYQLQCKIWV
ncbi:hypothetical protein QMY64_13785 [Phocaeicola dorei]|nr:hypothetical protein QMY64_13785 [Phocaeicola dorei]